MDRPDISRLSKNRSIHLNIGFVTALTVTIFAFNWTSYATPEKPTLVIVEDDMEIPVIRTATLKPKAIPPPPVLKVTNEVIIDEPEFITEPLPTVVEPTIEPVEPVVDLPVPTIEPVKNKPIAVAPVEKEPESELPFLVVEEMPRFPGCEEVGQTKEQKEKCAINRLLNFLGNNIKYPQMAKEAGIEGTVVLSFIVGKKGEIEDVKVLKSLGGGCSAESVRVAKKMPNWTPGKQRGKPVKVKYHLPVKFRLQ